MFIDRDRPPFRYTIHEDPAGPFLSLPRRPDLTGGTIAIALDEETTGHRPLKLPRQQGSCGFFEVDPPSREAASQSDGLNELGERHV